MKIENISTFCRSVYAARPESGRSLGPPKRPAKNRFLLGLFGCTLFSVVTGVSEPGSGQPKPHVHGQQPHSDTMEPNKPASQDAPTPPASRREDTVDVIFGTPVSDPYRWLEDTSRSEVKDWMVAQDAVARHHLHQLPQRELIAKRLRELFYVDSVTAPTVRNGRFFYSRTHADKEKRINYWRDGEFGKERVLLDPNTMSDDGSVAIGTVVPSWDGKTVVYALRENNADEATLHVKDVESGIISTIDTIPGAKYAQPRWTPDNSGFYYTFLPDDKTIPVDVRPGYAEVRFHRLGTPATDDLLIHPKTGSPQTFIGPALSRDGRWLFVYIHHGWNATDLFFRDLSQPDSTFQPFVVGRPALYQVIAHEGHFYIVTNDGAPKWRIYKTAVDNPAREHWVELIPESPDRVIDVAQIIGGHILITALHKASSQIAVFNLDGAFVRDIPLPEIGTTEGIVGEPDSDDAYFGFTSFTRPQQIYRTSIQTGKTTLWDEVILPIQPEKFMVEQVWYPSRDGTPVSMFVVRPKHKKLDGTMPLLLSGYGGFNVSLTPRFMSSFYPWIEAGGAFAMPNLRGGGEYGETWHQAGMLDKKQNVFDDFIAAADYLIQHGYTSKNKLAIRGGSNGGLLVGAVMTQRPDLCRAVICAVPLLDMVRYHLFGSGRTWIPEYGSAENEAQFSVLYAYSPYHHVKENTPYPALLMLSADSDDRVDPMHARKMTAALQRASTSGLPILLRIEENAGHGGADLVKQTVEQNADVYAFLFEQLGLTVTSDDDAD